MATKTVTPEPGTIEAQRQHTTDIASQIASDALYLRDLLENVMRYTGTGDDAEEQFTDCKLRGAQLLAARVGFFAEQIQRIHGDTKHVFIGDAAAWIAPDKLYTACHSKTAAEFNALNAKPAADAWTPGPIVCATKNGEPAPVTPAQAVLSDINARLLDLLPLVHAITNEADDMPQRDGDDDTTGPAHRILSVGGRIDQEVRAMVRDLEAHA